MEHSRTWQWQRRGNSKELPAMLGNPQVCARDGLECAVHT
jgi:hypothetical protein